MCWLSTRLAAQEEVELKLAFKIYKIIFAEVTEEAQPNDEKNVSDLLHFVVHHHLLG